MAQLAADRQPAAQPVADHILERGIGGQRQRAVGEQPVERGPHGRLPRHGVQAPER